VSLSRRAIIAAARRWIGTPWRHQGSVRDVGSDCIGLVRGVWRECLGAEPLAVPPYRPDWDESGDELLLASVAAAMPCAEKAHPGDVVLFRMNPHAPAKHAAILTEADTLVHAYWARAVVESRYGRFWRMRAAHAFSFPGALSWPS
jgi:NlpC/P60 family putative phage cell wall peptidase